MACRQHTLPQMHHVPPQAAPQPTTSAVSLATQFALPRSHGFSIQFSLSHLLFRWWPATCSPVCTQPHPPHLSITLSAPPLPRCPATDPSSRRGLYSSCVYLSLDKNSVKDAKGFEDAMAGVCIFALEAGRGKQDTKPPLVREPPAALVCAVTASWVT